MSDYSAGAELLLAVTAELGKVTDHLLDGKIVQADVIAVRESAKALADYFPILVAAYVFTGDATDEFIADARRQLTTRQGVDR